MPQLVAGRLGELLVRRLPPGLGLQAPSDPRQLRAALVDMRRHANRPRLVRDRALTRLADPPGRVRRELETASPVELLGRAVESYDALLDQVAEREAVTPVPLRDRHDQAQVRVDHALLRLPVTTLDPLRELDLFGRGQERIPPDLAHEERERVGGRHLSGSHTASPSSASSPTATAETSTSRVASSARTARSSSSSRSCSNASASSSSSPRLRAPPQRPERRSIVLRRSR